MENYYSVLGVASSASEEEIKKAYRKLSIKMHPDKNEGDQFFEEFFKKINEAYSVLGDKQSRKKYDAGFVSEKTRNEPVEKTVRKTENETRKKDVATDYSYVWQGVKNWRRIKNVLLMLNVCILLFAFAPRLGFELPFGKKNENGALYGIINTENSLNLRSLPSLDAEIVMKIPAKESVEILDESEIYLVIDGESANWLKVKFGNTVGWVWGGYVESNVLNRDEYVFVEEKNAPVLSKNEKQGGIISVIKNENHSLEKSFVDLENDDCYDNYELELINDRKLNFVPQGKGNVVMYEGKNVRFRFRDLNDKIGGELVLNGVEYSVSGYYTAEGNYEGSVWKSEENFGVMYWNVWHTGNCMSLTFKLNCKESEIEVCKNNSNPFFGGKEDNKNATGNDGGGNGKENKVTGSGKSRN